MSFIHRPGPKFRSVGPRSQTEIRGHFWSVTLVTGLLWYKTREVQSLLESPLLLALKRDPFYWTAPYHPKDSNSSRVTTLPLYLVSRIWALPLTDLSLIDPGEESSGSLKSRRVFDTWTPHSRTGPLVPSLRPDGDGKWTEQNLAL